MRELCKLLSLGAASCLLAVAFSAPAFALASVDLDLPGAHLSVDILPSSTPSSPSPPLSVDSLAQTVNQLTTNTPAAIVQQANTALTVPITPPSSGSADTPSPRPSRRAAASPSNLGFVGVTVGSLAVDTVIAHMPAMAPITPKKPSRATNGAGIMPYVGMAGLAAGVGSIVYGIRHRRRLA